MSPERFVNLFESHAAVLVLYARQWSSTPEDVVQTAFLRLAAVTRWPDDPVAWLFRVVRNAAIDQAKAEVRRRKHEVQAAGQVERWFHPAPDGLGIDAQAATAAVQSLPEDEREILVAHLWGGLTFEQIARLVGQSPATCHRRYHSALSRLRQLLRVPCPTIPETTK
jgi:RNA polymerase sigma factor (sigma-70 family)